MYKSILIALLVVGFLYNLVKSILQRKYKDFPIPENIRDVYDEEKYKTWRAYSAENEQLSMISEILVFVLTLAFLVFDVYALVYNWMPGNLWVKSMLTLGSYILLTNVLMLPISYVGTFRIEEKYGFNKSTKKTFVGDAIKQLLIEVILLIAMYCAAEGLYAAMGNTFFVVFYAGVVVFMLGMSMFSLTFQKIFYKFTPLEEGELRTALSEMFAAEGYQMKDIYVKNASSRTTHANAFCTGLGKYKSISLDDNLVNNYTPREITAVFAHELAHFKHKDTAKLTAYSMLILLVMTLLIASFVLVPQISIDCGFETANIMFAVLISNSNVIGMVMTLLGIPQAIMSRKCEYRADAFAAKKGYGKDIISALKKLHGDSLSNLNPHPMVVALEYSHPTLSQRAAAVEEEMAKLVK